MLHLSIFFTVCLVLGVKIITHEGMALHSLKVKADASGKGIWNMVTCEWCMPSLWSLAGYFFAFMYLFQKFPVEHWYKYMIFYPITVCASSVLAGTIWTVIIILLEYAKLFFQDKN